VRAQVVGKLVGSADALKIDMDVAHRCASTVNVPPRPRRCIGLSALLRARNYGADAGLSQLERIRGSRQRDR
jgi:hypothetical protein